MLTRPRLHGCCWLCHETVGGGEYGNPGRDRQSPAALITKAAAGYHERAWAMLVGSFSGTPFKLYALEAAKGPDYSLLLLAPFLHLPRFLAVATFSGGVSDRLKRWLDARSRPAVLMLLWLLFYAFYFSAMPG